LQIYLKIVNQLLAVDYHPVKKQKL